MEGSSSYQVPQGAEETFRLQEEPFQSLSEKGFDVSELAVVGKGMIQLKSDPQ